MKMNKDLASNADAYLHLHADCIPVKGAVRSAIYDLTRNELIFFPTGYYEVLDYLTSDRIGPLLEMVTCEEEKRLVLEFIEFLNQNEFISFLKDPAMFPPIEVQWDMPAIIQNAIVDVDTIPHDFERIFQDLDVLGCQFVQIRSFSGLLNLEDLYQILSFSHHKSIAGLELILKYDPGISDDAYTRLIEDQAIISSLILHSSPQERTIIVDYGCDEESGRYITKQILLVEQCIDSHLHCGMIAVNALSAPTVDTFFEAQLHNGCLNRKVSIDAAGEIKNCPSMSQSYGNIRDTSLAEAIARAGFQDKWHITKDQIAICRDCELRYVCSDCRAYLENPLDLYSKPLKCGYNPYTAEWQEWSQNPLRQSAIGYYGLESL
jgi:SPASM domain peptide maturase of grasp-with-spasm system